VICEMSNSKMGRPIKADARRNDINIRLTEKELQVIKDVAERHNLSRTDAIVNSVKYVNDNNIDIGIYKA